MIKHILTGVLFFASVTACFGQQTAADTRQTAASAPQTAADTRQTATTAPQTAADTRRTAASAPQTAASAPHTADAARHTADAARHTWRFRSDNYGGLSVGQMGSYGQARTVNGLTQGPWFVGLGAGLDYYRFRNIPLFLSATRDLTNGKRDGLFFILDAGVDLPWYKRKPQPYENLTSTFRAGPFWNTGLGYRWRFSDAGRKALLFSATYGMKKLTERQTTAGACYDPPACTINSQTADFDYTDRTLRLGVGVEF